MSGALYQNYHGLPVSEAVPGAIDMSDLKVSSILQSRRRIRWQPQTGVSAGPQSIIQFVLSDSTGLMDLNSMVLSFTPTVDDQTLGANKFNWFDDGPSMIRRVQVIANGSLIDDVDLAHKAANIELYSSAGAEWIKHDGSFMNYYKLNETLGVGATAQNNAFGHAVSVSADLSGSGFQMGIPMGLIAPSLKSNKYWPLRNMGELNIQITTAALTEAIWSNTATPPSTYSLNDIYLEVDIITPSPMFCQLMDRMCQLESEAGLVIPVETKLVSAGQNIPASVGALSESSIVTSRATTNLRRVDFAVQPTTGLSVLGYPSVSCFPDAGFSQIQWRVGSLYFPQQPANSLARAFYMTAAAYGEVNNSDSSAVFNRQNYDVTTTVNGATVYINRPGAGGQFGGTLAADAAANGVGTYRYAYADFAPKSYNFDNFKGGQQLDNDGVSVLGQAGSQIVTQVRLANPVDVTALVCLTATKYIHIHNGGLTVKGA